MQKYKTLFTVMLAFAIILSMATGVLATEQEHVHNWVLLNGGLRGHTSICSGCGQSKLEDHTVDSSEICTVCGYYYHTHNWQCVWSNDYHHCIVCSSCSEEKTATHSKDSAGICTICGHTPHEHIWQYNDGQNYGNRHGMRCTQCAATTIEDHIYGSDGKCTVCGNAPPHVHQWEWDGSKLNHYQDHYFVCSCGAKKSEPHQFCTWDGKIENDLFHTMLCGVCGFALLFEHRYDSAYFNGERCTVCGYQAQGTAVPQTKPSETESAENKPNETDSVETDPAENKPNETDSAENKPSETDSVETGPAENKPNETELSETKPEETKPAEIEPEETMPQKAAKEGLQRSSSVWIWVATILVVVGGLGTVVFFLKKKSS